MKLRAAVGTVWAERAGYYRRAAAGAAGGALLAVLSLLTQREVWSAPRRAEDVALLVLLACMGILAVLSPYFIWRVSLRLDGWLLRLLAVMAAGIGWAVAIFVVVVCGVGVIYLALDLGT